MTWARSKGYKAKVPPIVKLTIEYLSREECLVLPGLFRKAGDFAEAKVIRTAFDRTGMAKLDGVRDEHAVAKTLKDYLRELPQPLIPFAKYDECIIMQKTITDPETKREAVKALLSELDPVSRATLKYILAFCRRVAEYEHHNLMGAPNLALVIGPNILRTTNLGQEVMNTGYVAQFVTELITLKFCPSSAPAQPAPSQEYYPDNAEYYGGQDDQYYGGQGEYYGGEGYYPEGGDYYGDGVDDDDDDDDDFDLAALVSSTASLTPSTTQHQPQGPPPLLPVGGPPPTTTTTTTTTTGPPPMPSMPPPLLPTRTTQQQQQPSVPPPPPPTRGDSRHHVVADANAPPPPLPARVAVPPPRGARPSRRPPPPPLQ